MYCILSLTEWTVSLQSECSEAVARLCVLFFAEKKRSEKNFYAMKQFLKFLVWNSNYKSKCFSTKVQRSIHSAFQAFTLPIFLDASNWLELQLL